MVAWKSWLTDCPSGRSRQALSHSVVRPLERPGRRVRRPDRNRLAVLDLDDAHLLGDVLPGVVELQRAEERLLVERGQLVPYRVGVGAAGLLHGERERQARGGRLRVVVLGFPAAELLGEA